MTRRNLIGSAGLAAAVSAKQLPLKSDFPVVNEGVCLNNARWHPASCGARRAMEKFMDYKAGGGITFAEGGSRAQKDAKDLFAKLINASPDEIAFIQSTSMGENLVFNGMKIMGTGGNVVTDALHFEGSLYLYGEMAKQGLDVRVVRPTKDWRIRPEDLDKAIDRNTKLVAISQVSMMTGFEHDLKTVSDLAHAKGAVVYADIIQAAGAMPIDVKAAGVDFCACSTYKWLMGDFGLGFLYARQDRLGSIVKRSVYGYRQLNRLNYHMFPHDPPGTAVMDWGAGKDAASYFEIGTLASIVAAALVYSLDYIQQIGVAQIQAYRKPMIERLQKEMPRLGFEPLTPPETQGPIVAFAMKDAAAKYAEKLNRAKVDVSVSRHRIRVSPSVYNDQKDIDRLLEALS